MALKYKDGMKIGPENTLLIKRTERKGSKYYAVFKCSFCGQEFETCINSIVSGHTRSCGCLNTQQRKITGKNNAKDISNQRFGKLIAIKPTEERSQRKIKWLCKCDCGNFIKVSISDLLNGHTKSCGCLKSGGELIIQKILQEEEIEYEKEKIFLGCKNPKTNNTLRFDFFLPKYNICIECHGEQHFREVNYFGGKQAYQHRVFLDKIKENYCLQNNIKLIIIPYKNNGDIDKVDLLSQIFE